MLELDKIYNEDCLVGMEKIEDGSVDMILCDLPYGTTQNKWDSVIPFEPLWKQYLRIAKENAAIVLTAAQPFTSLVVASNLKHFKYEWIWRKSLGMGFLNAKKQPLRNHESVLVFYRKQPTYNPQFTDGKPYSCRSNAAANKGNYGKFKDNVTVSDGRRYPLTVQDFKHDKAKLHPTQKPLALFEYLIRTYTKEGEVILDNCIGSGTTAVAAKNTGRRFIGFEETKEYFETAQARVASL